MFSSANQLRNSALFFSWCHHIYNFFIAFNGFLNPIWQAFLGDPVEQLSTMCSTITVANFVVSLFFSLFCCSQLILVLFLFLCGGWRPCKSPSSPMWYLLQMSPCLLSCSILYWGNVFTLMFCSKLSWQLVVTTKILPFVRVVFCVCTRNGPYGCCQRGDQFLQKLQQSMLSVQMVRNSRFFGSFWLQWMELRIERLVTKRFIKDESNESGAWSHGDATVRTLYTEGHASNHTNNLSKYNSYQIVLLIAQTRIPVRPIATLDCPVKSWLSTPSLSICCIPLKC